MTFCFIRAHFCKNTGAFFAKIRAKIQAKFKFVMLSSFFDLVHIQKVAKQLNILIYINILITLWTCTKSQKYGQNHKNTGKITKIRAKSQKYGRFSTNARIYGHVRINTGDLFTLCMYFQLVNHLAQKKSCAWNKGLWHVENQIS